MRSIALLAITLLASACTDDVGISGVWTGVVGNTGFSLTLVETDRGAVTGSGRIFSSVFNAAANVTGAHAHPAVAFTITSSGIVPIGYQGTFGASANAIRGALNGSGFFGDSLHLVRSTPASSQITAP